MAISKSEQLNLIMKRLWLETSKLFPEVDYIYYGDELGTFLGYERLPLEFVRQYHTEPSVFGGEFRAPNGLGGIQLCEMCPPATDVKPGEKTYYFVNKEGEFFQTYRRHEYNPLVRPWYERAKEAKGKLIWLDIYNHTSGHTLGMTAAKAIMSNSKVVAVVAADFTISYFVSFLKKVTSLIKGEEGDGRKKKEDHRPK